MGNGLMPWLRRTVASCALSWLLPAADGPPTQISGSKVWGKVMATDWPQPAAGWRLLQAEGMVLSAVMGMGQLRRRSMAA
jgi:hypothetical protein